MFVSFVNPHDIMYFNTDAPGENVQDTGKLRRAGRRRMASLTGSGTISVGGGTAY
jgi:hypothetical protein